MFKKYVCMWRSIHRVTWPTMAWVSQVLGELNKWPARREGLLNMFSPHHLIDLGSRGQQTYRRQPDTNCFLHSIHELRTATNHLQITKYTDCIRILCPSHFLILQCTNWKRMSSHISRLVNPGKYTVDHTACNRDDKDKWKKCGEINLEEIMQDFSCPIKNFSCTYLPPPLHYRKLNRIVIQPIVDKMATRLPAWKGKFLNKAGRLKLLNSVLTAVPTYFPTVSSQKNTRQSRRWTKSEEAFFGETWSTQMEVTVLCDGIRWKGQRDSWFRSARP